jgi:hypothetical protein
MQSESKVKESVLRAKRQRKERERRVNEERKER